jgi:hypothetical protein
MRWGKNKSMSFESVLVSIRNSLQQCVEGGPNSIRIVIGFY